MAGGGGASYLSLVEADVLYGAVGFGERFEGVGHKLVPQSGLLLIRDAEELPHLLLYGVWENTERRVRHSLDGCSPTGKAP